MPNRRITTADRVTIARRRTRAIELKMSGLNIVQIGRALAADPAINTDGESYPAGYGSSIYEAGEPPPDDARLKALVVADLRRTLNHQTIVMTEQSAEMRAIEDSRLERLMFAIWDDCLAGDLKAIDRALRIMERKAKLHGMDAPQQLEVVAVGTSVEPHNLVAELEQLRQVWQARLDNPDRPVLEAAIVE